MDHNYFAGVLQCLIGLVGSLFFSGNIIKRAEDGVSNFYHPLRKKYPHSYVRQNKIIRVIRRLFKMRTDMTIHWVCCVYHYLQIIAMVSFILTFVLSPILHNYVSFWTMLSFDFVISICHVGIIGMTRDLWMIIEEAKCKKIRKEDPKYAKREIYQWRS